MEHEVNDPAAVCQRRPKDGAQWLHRKDAVRIGEDLPELPRLIDGLVIVLHLQDELDVMDTFGERHVGAGNFTPSVSNKVGQ